MRLFVFEDLVEQDDLYEIYHQCRASSADEWQGESGIRKYFHIHPYIYECLHQDQ